MTTTDWAAIAAALKASHTEQTGGDEFYPQTYGAPIAHIVMNHHGEYPDITYSQCEILAPTVGFRSALPDFECHPDDLWDEIGDLDEHLRPYGVALDTDGAPTIADGDLSLTVGAFIVILDSEA